jgi:hypothetical protein
MILPKKSHRATLRKNADRREACKIWNASGKSLLHSEPGEQPYPAVPGAARRVPPAHHLYGWKVLIYLMQSK